VGSNYSSVVVTDIGEAI